MSSLYSEHLKLGMCTWETLFDIICIRFRCWCSTEVNSEFCCLNEYWLICLLNQIRYFRPLCVQSCRSTMGKNRLNVLKSGAQLGQMAKPRQKLDFENREIDWFYTCNSLTSFESDADTINKDYVNLLKLNCKNSWNHFSWTYFWRILAFCNYCARTQAKTHPVDTS